MNGYFWAPEEDDTCGALFWERSRERETGEPIIILYARGQGMAPVRRKLSVRLKDMSVWGKYADRVGVEVGRRGNWFRYMLPEEIKTEEEAKAYIETVIRMGAL